MRIATSGPSLPLHVFRQSPGPRRKACGLRPGVAAGPFRIARPRAAASATVGAGARPGSTGVRHVEAYGVVAGGARPGVAVDGDRVGAGVRRHEIDAFVAGRPVGRPARPRSPGAGVAADHHAHVDAALLDRDADRRSPAARETAKRCSSPRVRCRATTDPGAIGAAARIGRDARVRQFAR